MPHSDSHLDQLHKIAELKNVFDFDGRRQHAFNKLEWHAKSVKRGRFLDIGCGPGNGIVAALQQGFSTAVGIDRDLSEFRDFTIPLDDLCLAYEVDPASAILVQADIDNVSFSPRSFDCVLMLDSIEHVPIPSKFIRYAAEHVCPDGIVLIDTCPLYFSKSGAHLFNYFDPAEHPWVHLRRDFQELVDARAVDDWTLQRYHELNRVTTDDILSFITECGLDIEYVHRSKPTEPDLQLLESHRHSLELSGMDESLLFEDWVLIVAKRPA